MNTFGVTVVDLTVVGVAVFGITVFGVTVDGVAAASHDTQSAKRRVQMFKNVTKICKM